MLTAGLCPPDGPAAGAFFGFPLRTAMDDDIQLKQLIAEYERLRERSLRLFQEWEGIDQRMQEIESELPDSYTYPGDPPLDGPPGNGRPSPSEPPDDPTGEDPCRSE